MIYRAMKTSRPLAALCIGLLGTLIILAAFLADWDVGTELRALDMRFGLTDAPLPDDILHVDINDESLRRVGRWPWPREKHAAIVDILHDCGAKAVMIDLILNEPQQQRYVAPAYDVHTGNDAKVFSKDTKPQPVFDDSILEEAITRAGNVFLVMHVSLTKQTSPTIEAYDKVSRFVSANPNVDMKGVIDNVPGQPDILRKAFLYHSSVEATQRFAIPDNAVERLDPPSGRMTPPFVRFGQAALGAGCATYLPDPDKMVRRIPLFFRGNGKVYPQFAVAMALHELGARHGGIEFMKSDESSFTIRCRDGQQRVVPLDSNGFMLIRWPRKAIQDAGPKFGLEHIPASAAVNIWLEREKLKDNTARLQALRTEFLNMGQALPENEEIKRTYWQYVSSSEQFDKAYIARINQERQLRTAILFYPSKAFNARLQLAESKRAENEAQELRESTRAFLATALRKPGNIEPFLGKPAATATQPANPEALQTYAKALAKSKELLDRETEILVKNREFEDNIEILTRELREKVQNKICMLGATSSGVPDFVSTPLEEMTPGVIVHTNIMNTILSGNFVYPAGVWTNTLTILLAGLLVSLIAASRPVLQAIPLSLLAAAAYALFNIFIVFAMWGVWVVLIAPLGAMLVSFLFVTAFRQLTEERAKRRIRERFAKSLSPALVEQLLTDPSLASPGGRKTELTCMFSDLAGFTPLSESLGPQETVKLLNRYFDIVTDIVQTRCDGYLNKFLGDGLFVLFGVPIALENHPSRAVDAALMCQTAVAELNDALASEMSDNVKLNVRIGIHGGQAMFGNCGSTEREDYTAIGDCVNLSARLESANKFFGTKIIVSEHTWGLCNRNDLLVRPLGKAFITGVRNSLNLVEVVGPVDEINESHRKAAPHFAEAMELISNRKFAAARTELLEFDKLRPGDQTAKIYLDICQQCIAWGSEINAWPAECMTSGGVVRLAWPKRT